MSAEEPSQSGTACAHDDGTAVSTLQAAGEDEVDLSVTMKSLVLPSTLSLGQIPDCSNVLQNRVRCFCARDFPWCHTAACAEL